MTTITDPDDHPREDVTRTRPPRERRSARRPVAAGHAILAMLVAFAIGTLFNADSLLQTAQTQKLGTWRHRVGVDIMKPVHSFSELLRLDRPRRALDEKLGNAPPASPSKHEERASSDPFATPSTTTVPHGPTTTAKHGSRYQALTVSRAHPATVFVAGDSLSFEFGTSLYRIAAGEHVYTAGGSGTIDYRVSSGLARPDYFNWPAALGNDVQRFNPQIVVLMLGSNDNQPIAANGHTYAFGTDGWKAEYHRRVGAVMDQLIARNRWVVYVGVPILATRNDQWPVINTVIEEEASKRSRAVYIDSFSLFQDPNGNYTQYLPNSNGQLVEVRTDDGVHFQRAGADLLARRTLQVMERTIVHVSRK